MLFATRVGIVKKTELSDYSNVRKGGIIAINIEDGDELIEAELTNGNDSLVLITHDGMSLRFNEEDVRSMGRTATGVWGIRPEDGDYLVAMVVVKPEATLLVAGENGIGKRTSFEEYREQTRGGKGIITMKTGDKTGGVVGALTVMDDGRTDAHHQQGQDGPHPGQRNPRDRAQHERGQAYRTGPQREAPGHRVCRQPGRRRGIRLRAAGGRR